jgi:hypothetical protein
LGAHVHGALKLDLAVENNSLFFDLDGPAEAILGFEHAPKSAADKKTFAEAETIWKKDFLSKLFILDKKLDCKTSEVTFKQVMEGGSHSDVEAQTKVTCAEKLSGQVLTVALKKQFPHIKKLTIEVIGSEVRSIDSKPVEEVKL